MAAAAGWVGWCKLVGAIALTDHSVGGAAVARFEKDRSRGRTRTAAAGYHFALRSFGENDFQLARARGAEGAGMPYYLHLRPLRGGEIVRRCTFREKQGQNVLITAGLGRSLQLSRSSRLALATPARTPSPRRSTPSVPDLPLFLQPSSPPLRIYATYRRLHLILMQIRHGVCFRGLNAFCPRAIQCHRDTCDVTVNLIEMEMRRGRLVS